MAKNKKVKKIVSFVISGIALAGAAFGIYNIVQTQQQNQPQIETLATPTIMFNDNTNILSWNQVENATSYVVSINGKEVTVDTTSTKVDINEKTTEMKVKAKSNQGYNDSQWSNAYTYTVSAEDTQKNLRIVISDFLGDEAQLKEIVSTCIKGNNIYLSILTNRDNKEYIERVAISCPNNITSLSEALLESNVKNSSLLEGSSSETVKYDTLSEIIKQEKYGYDIEDYVNQGYEVSVVNSATAKFDDADDKAYYSVYGLLKLTKGTEVKYVDVSYSVETQKGSGDVSYIDYISNDSKTSIDVSYANELSGDAYDFAKELDQEQTQVSSVAKTATQKTASDVILEDDELGYEA